MKDDYILVLENLILLARKAKDESKVTELKWYFDGSIEAYETAKNYYIGMKPKN